MFVPVPVESKEYPLWDPLYSDLEQENPTRKSLAVDEEAIRQSLTNILTTEPGERLFNPEFGAGLENFIHELMDEPTAFAIKNVVIDAVSRWEPRIVLDLGLTQVVPVPDYHLYWIVVAYRIRGLEDRIYQYQGSLVRSLS